MSLIFNYLNESAVINRYFCLIYSYPKLYKNICNILNINTYLFKISLWELHKTNSTKKLQGN